MTHDTPRATRLTLAALLTAAPAAAQDRSVGDELRDGMRDMLNVWSSPFHATTADLEGIVLIGGLTAATLALDQPIYEWLERHPRSVPAIALGPFRESSPLSLIGRSKLLLPVAATMYATGIAIDSDDLRDAGIGCAAANVATSLSRTTLNRIIGRQRPEMGDGPYVFKPFTFTDWDVRSFPGGHAANIMSCAAYWNHRFELGAGEPLLYLLAGTIGTARVVDGAHWLSDTVFGLAWGFAVGKAIAGRASERAAEMEAGTAQPAAVLMWSIRF